MDLNHLKKYSKVYARLALPTLPHKRQGERAKAPSYIAKVDSGWGLLQALSPRKHRHILSRILVPRAKQAAKGSCTEHQGLHQVTSRMANKDSG